MKKRRANKDIFNFSLAVFFLALLFLAGVYEKKVQSILISLADSIKNTASVFFVASITEDDLLSRYKLAKKGRDTIKIIIVAGHDDESPGTVYKGRREADMNAELAEALASFLEKDDEFEIVLTRTKLGYNPNFWDYRTRSENTLYDFISAKKLDMKKLMSEGSVSQHDSVKHNKAPANTITILYTINRWANETSADIVLHIHFNDAAERKRSEPYKYNGFAIYVPEKQYSNAAASHAVAEPIFTRLNKLYASSNLPKENAGIVESQNLIAIGSYNTLDAVGMLIEYGYIYEPQFETDEVRVQTIIELAWQTYLGLHDFFKTTKSERLALLGALGPLDTPIESRSKDKASILDIQKALLVLGFYPPDAKNKRDCPLSGNFGPCTEIALKRFQAEENILDESGKAGEKTLEILRKKLKRLGL